MEYLWAVLYPHPVSKAGGTGFYRFLVLDLTEAERCQVRSRHLLAFPMYLFAILGTPKARADIQGS